MPNAKVVFDLHRDEAIEPYPTSVDTLPMGSRRLKPLNARLLAAAVAMSVMAFLIYNHKNAGAILCDEGLEHRQARVHKMSPSTHRFLDYQEELPGKLKLEGYLGRLLDRQVSWKVEDKDGRRKGLMDEEMEGKLEIQVGLHVNVSAGLLLMYLQPTGKLVKIEGVDLPAPRRDELVYPFPLIDDQQALYDLDQMMQFIRNLRHQHRENRHGWFTVIFRGVVFEFRIWENKKATGWPNGAVSQMKQTGVSQYFVSRLVGTDPLMPQFSETQDMPKKELNLLQKLMALCKVMSPWRYKLDASRPVTAIIRPLVAPPHAV
ncbi:hypothetical protein, conserved [Eimeria maxima]|uniref:Uncharacterized protein n=1 Tax=Eimeria maxima TaxID=5804 RepID=U6M7Q1_EIMMA|nr:hypothetical protein, conserved [Eimeria maxima]CDJ60247.1 hypothetical protein, conserved [Eimeria maxima]